MRPTIDSKPFGHCGDRWRWGRTRPGPRRGRRSTGAEAAGRSSPPVRRRSTASHRAGPRPRRFHDVPLPASRTPSPRRMLEVVLDERNGMADRVWPRTWRRADGQHIGSRRGVGQGRTRAPPPAVRRATPAAASGVVAHHCDRAGRDGRARAHDRRAVRQPDAGLGRVRLAHRLRFRPRGFDRQGVLLVRDLDRDRRAPARARPRLDLLPQMASSRRHPRCVGADGCTLDADTCPAARSFGAGARRTDRRHLLLPGLRHGIVLGHARCDGGEPRAGRSRAAARRHPRGSRSRARCPRSRVLRCGLPARSAVRDHPWPQRGVRRLRPIRARRVVPRVVQARGAMPHTWIWPGRAPLPSSRRCRPNWASQSPR